MAVVLHHKMWLKQFLKGFAERIPEKVWVSMAVYFFSLMSHDLQTQAMKVENLNEAYKFGYDLAAHMFGGEEERS